MFPSVTFLYVSFCAHYVSSLHDSQTPQFCTSPYLLISSLMFSVPLISCPDLSEHLVYIFLEPVLDTLELILLGLTRTLPRFPWTLGFRFGSGCLSLLFSSPISPTRVLVWTVDSCLSDSSFHLFSVRSDPTGSERNNTVKIPDLFGVGREWHYSCTEGIHANEKQYGQWGTYYALKESSCVCLTLWEAKVGSCFYMSMESITVGLDHTLRRGTIARVTKAARFPSVHDGAIKPPLVHCVWAVQEVSRRWNPLFWANGTGNRRELGLDWDDFMLQTISTAEYRAREREGDQEMAGKTLVRPDGTLRTTSQNTLKVGYEEENTGSNLISAPSNSLRTVRERKQVVSSSAGIQGWW